jgi:hypothetical protein
MKSDSIDYSRLVDEAMHVIVFKVLKRVEEEGLPGEHHFFISFLTKYKGVNISNDLSYKYPNEMTIVLQHQYQDLKVDSKGFSITLSFNGRKENLYIPYCAVTSFADPSVQFGLQFREIEYDIDDSDLNMDPHDLTSVNEKAKKETSKQNESTSAKVISFESIRKQSKN